jgi:hypothetical protein
MVEKKSTYDIKVKAKDTRDNESEWSDLIIVTMPRNRVITSSLFLHFFQDHPNLFPLFQRLLQRLGL